MVQEVPRIRQQGPFPDAAPAAFPVFYRTYSRRGEVVPGQRETWDQVCDRTLEGLKELGNLTDEEMALLNRMQRQVKALPSGRWLWVGGTAWSKQPENFSGAYNCTSTNVVDWRAFGLMMDLAMMGCGTGAILEPKYINQIPAIRNRLSVTMGGDIGTTPAAERREITEVAIDGNQVNIRVGDSRQGWVQSYQTLLELSTDERFTDTVEVTIDLSDVRPAGEKLKGFGGVANPIRLSLLYDRCANILNKALGRQLNSVECCLLIDEAAACVVAGNIRRCLPEDALVHTEAGLVPIAKVRIGDRVLTSKGLYPVTNFFVQGEQSLCRIRTQDGEFECTADHKVAVLTDVFGQYQMVKAKDLKAGDRLVFVPQAIPGTPTELPEFRGEIKGKTKPIQIPALTTQVAYFLGYLQGDGSVASDGWRVRFRVHEDSPAILDRLIEVGQEFGLDTHTLRTPEQCKTKAYELQFNSSALNQYLQQFKQASQPLTVPDCILLGTPEIRKAFLAGLADADGCHSQGVLVASVHKRFLQQVQALYASLGITVRMCSSVRKRNNQWEGELVTVGQAAFEAVASAFETHSIQFPVNRREAPKRFNDHGFPKDMVRPLVSSTLYHWGAVHQQMNQQTLKKYVPNATDLVPVKVKGVDLNVRTAPTYDIEVATVHEFMCEGILVSNSAGMRQFDSNDDLAAGAKDNLWQQDAEGNWRIDPERDVLRMANHTRVFHEKPSLQDCVDSVRKQFYSGEGAIQWAGEAKRRANGSERYGLNPCGEIIGSNFHCVAGSTLMITRDGLHPIQSLVGQTVEVWNGRRWSQVVPVQTGQNRQMYRVSFGDGTWLDVTGKHRFFVGDRFSSTYKELTTEELRDRIESHPYALHTEPFKIDYRDGEFVDPTWAYTLGQLVGDGSLCQSNGKPQLQLRLYGAKSYQSLALAGRTSGKLRYYAENPETPCLLYTGFQDNFDPEQVRALKAEAQALDALAGWNREGILHFVAGLIDADGSETPSGGVRLYISDYERAYRLYLLLLKCGIRSSINLAAKAGSETNLGVRQKDLWYLQITDCAAIPCQRVDTSKGHAPKAKGKWQVIRSVEPLPGQHDSFCFNEPEFHKGVFGGTLTGQCNLSEVHLNQLDPANLQDQEDAFTASALSVAVLLNHQFNEPRYQQSRLEDPIVGVSFTGLFDFFVQAFGVDWLRWWEAGRPDTMQGLEFKQKEQDYLTRWKDIVHRVVWDYCDRHGLHRPNRCTTVQPAGTKSLLTGASPGWHPPKAQRFLRRITFRKNDPVAMACIDYGYSVVPSQSDKDESGNLLNDPFDPRCTEWLVEIPVEVPWANLPGADEIAIEKFTAAAQFDFYMQVQKHYTTHNTSATIEFREPELEALGERIYQAIQNDEGYISAALLARFDDLQTFPRLPFEPIDKATYEAASQKVEARRGTADFHSALAMYDAGDLIEAGPAGCDSDKCMMPEQKPE